MDGQWTVTARCPKGHSHTVPVDALGRLDVPLCEDVDVPEAAWLRRMRQCLRRPRAWWEARRMRRWLRRLSVGPDGNIQHGDE